MVSVWSKQKRARARTRSFRIQADKLRDEKRYRDAAGFYERVLEHEPDDVGIRIQAGHMRKEAGDLVLAEAHYLRAKSQHPEDGDLNLQIGHFYKVAGRSLDALAYYRNALVVDPKNADARSEHREMGRRVRTQMGAPDADVDGDARASLDKAVAALTIEDVRASGLFEAAWYLKHNQDIAALGVDPLQHFFEYGRAEGRRPGAGFEPDWYLSSYPEVAHAGVDPFTHYLASGRAQGLRPAGPPMYERWVGLYDTLGDVDFRQIDADIAARSLAQPEVLLAVDAVTLPFLSRAVRSLRSQRLRPLRVHVCLPLELRPGATATLDALFGQDDMFRLRDPVRDDGIATPFAMGLDPVPLVVMDAGIELRPHALYLLGLARDEGARAAYGDHDRLDAEDVRIRPFFKPAMSPELLRQSDYIGPLALLPPAASVDALASGLMRGDDVAALIAEALLGESRLQVAHVPHVLFHDRADQVRRVRPSLPSPSLLEGAELPSVTVVIPTRDRVELLSVCVESLLSRTDYPRDLLDIVVVDNGSTDEATLNYLRVAGSGRFRVIRDPLPFNFARLNNLAIATSQSDVVVLLNNDTEVENAGWLLGLVRYAVLPDVGAVGPKLLYDDGTIQHAGVLLGIGVAAAHADVGIDHDAGGSYGFAQRTREVSAVTGACLAMRRSVFDEVAGLDEDLAVAFNDVDLCLKFVERGYRNLYVHDVWLRHFESKSRGVDDTPAKVDIFIGEANYARRKHAALFAADPFYNPNLSVMLDTMYEPAFPPRCGFPWRNKALSGQSPRVLILADIADAVSEVAIVVAMQAEYLVDRGYDVVIGMQASHAAIAIDKRVRVAPLHNMESAASYAVRHHVDAIVVHTAGFAGVSRLLGEHPKVLLHHHGFRIERKGTGTVGRDETVAIRLALPAAAMVVATSPAAAAELEGDAILLPPGGDRLGRLSVASEERRQAIRKAMGWDDRVVILVEGEEEPLASGRDAFYRAVADRLDLGKVSLVNLGQATLPEPYHRLPRHRSRAGLFTAGDVLWPFFDGSPLCRAEAAAFGVAIVDVVSAKDNAGQVAQAIAIAAAANSRYDRAMRADAVSWSEVLARFETLLADACLGGARPLVAAPPCILASKPMVEESGLFDPDAYLRFNTDIAEAKIDPWEHFAHHGGPEGRRASYLFDPKWYLSRYPEVGMAALSPLAHYLSQPTGMFDPNPYFSNQHYLETYPEVAESGLAPLVHYLRFGARSGATIGKGFDADFYARTNADVATSGVLPFVHFLSLGDEEGRLPVRPELSPVDLFDDMAVVGCLNMPIDVALPRAVAADDVIDQRSAAAFLIHLLRNRPDLRAQFPQALSQRDTGAFANWIRTEGAQELGLGSRQRHFIIAVLGAGFVDELTQTYLVRTDLRRLMPFALLPEGAGGFLRWALGSDAPAGLSREEIWWFALLWREDPALALVTTYRFTPSWQRNFPAALTVFQDREFCGWARGELGIDPAWDDTTVAELLPAADALRLGYNANAVWRAERPDAFASLQNAEALLDWLGGDVAELSVRAKDWLAAQDRPNLLHDMARPGVNMIGHFCYPSGLKTSTEALVRGCRDVGLTVTERDVWVQLPGDEPHHVDFCGDELYDTTIILCQPEPFFDVAYSRAGLAPRDARTYRIAYWYWEQDEIPDTWIKYAETVDEVWTSTGFVGDALRKKLHKPVRVIPHGIELLPYEKRSRSHFGLPEDRFLFLFTFHMMSVMERKNPLGLIEAFAREFRPDENVGLVLKTSFGSHHPQQMAELRRAAERANITIIDSVYTKPDVLALMDSCDAYVSLHRSEGFGLTMAEAMLIGKPTIATGYSANLDFMTRDNSLLVDYKLVKLDRDYPPYKAGSHWAEASTKHAGECMRRLVDDPGFAIQLGEIARRDLTQRMSFAASGRMIQERLAEIEAERRLKA